MNDYLCMRFRNKTLQELSDFEEQVGKIISHLENCPSIDLSKFSPNWRFCRNPEAVEKNASEIRRVLCLASRLRVMASATFQVACPSPPPPPVSPLHSMGYYHHAPPPHLHHHHHHQYFHPLSAAEGTSRKRMREEEDMSTPQLHHHHHQQHHQFNHHHPRPHPHYYNKVARVTPVMMER
jgi:hypothetical protein